MSRDDTMPDDSIARDSLIFWERGRLIFNGVLVIWAALLIWWRFEPPPALAEYLNFLALFALVANLGFCAAYPLDLAAQTTRLRVTWRHWRWALLAAGTALTGYVLSSLISSA